MAHPKRRQSHTRQAKRRTHDKAKMPALVKEFFNYIKKKNGARKDKIKSLQALIERLENGTASETEMGEDSSAALAKARQDLDKIPKQDFKGIIGCEVYVAHRRLHNKEGKEDQGGYHLILLAKNMQATRWLFTYPFRQRLRQRHASLCLRLITCSSPPTVSPLLFLHRIWCLVLTI